MENILKCPNCDVEMKMILLLEHYRFCHPNINLNTFRKETTKLRPHKQEKHKQTLENKKTRAEERLVSSRYIRCNVEGTKYVVCGFWRCNFSHSSSRVVSSHYTKNHKVPNNPRRQNGKTTAKTTTSHPNVPKKPIEVIQIDD